MSCVDLSTISCLREFELLTVPGIYNIVIMPKSKHTQNDLAINNGLKMHKKTMSKLQSLEELINTVYCLPSNGTIYTGGWENMSNLIRAAINKEDQDFTEMVKTDFTSIATKEDHKITVKPILPVMPPSKECNRDQLRNLVTEMIRISQNNGEYHALKDIYYVLIYNPVA